MKRVAALLGCTTFASAAFIAQTSTGGVQSPPAPDAPRPAFNELDRNADGRLSYLEAKQDERLIGQFYRMDLDLDGFISPYELSRFQV